MTHKIVIPYVMYFATIQIHTQTHTKTIHTILVNSNKSDSQFLKCVNAVRNTFTPKTHNHNNIYVNTELFEYKKEMYINKKRYSFVVSWFFEQCIFF